MNERKRLNASERQAFMDLCVAMEALKRSSPEMDERLRSIPRLQNLRNSCIGFLRKILRETLRSVPAEQVASIERNLRTMRYYITVTNATGRPMANDGRWLSFDALDAITEATRDRCMVCQKNAQEQRQCKLAKALDELPCINADEKAWGCRYFGGV